MGRKSIIFGFGLLGFILGFLGYVAWPSINAWLIYFLPQIFSNELIFGAVLSGIVGSIIMMFSVALWVKISR
ncbi:MAG: hypothetical protein MUO21_09570 [Nitrososphaeraceae archaeon]|nr:hypothetical protein [Nitrososphaeraceae archaeon]